MREVFDRGKRYGCQGAKLFVLKNDLPFNRICFTFPRSFGNAVSRNRARRLGRESFRLTKHELLSGHDLIFLVYPEPESAEKRRQDCQRQLESLFKKAGLLK
ncbi:MAG: ribonuclease P protein component [Treponema sp.]|nr:ribonuclease P protein component [Treponema sp.]MCL2237083.1 ribonuclease P protein component [Treponema sp.]